jgi:hypothetical protein
MKNHEKNMKKSCEMEFGSGCQFGYKNGCNSHPKPMMLTIYITFNAVIATQYNRNFRT